MKRFLLGLGCSLAVSGAVAAQDPAARLGRPVVRAQAPDFQPAGGFEAPRVMPKGSVTESAGPSPLPSPATVPGPAAAFAGPAMPGLPGVPSGPVVLDPTGPPPGPPIPGGPTLVGPPAGGLFGDQIGCPTGGCPTVCETAPWYGGVEGLLWWIKSNDTPPLVTVGPAGSGATLSTPGVNIAYGGNPVNTNPRYGARLTLGKWLTPCWAVEASAFYVRPNTQTFYLNSAQVADGDLARPFFSLNRGVQWSDVIGRPGVASGDVRVESRSQLFGAELNGRRRWWESGANRIDLLCGLRYLYLEESLTITEQSTALPGVVAPFAGASGQVTDRITTKNQFYGAQVGAIFSHTHGPWTIDLRAKVAFGVNREYSDISGTTVPIAGSLSPDRPGGLLALSSNIGQTRKDVFAWVPEVGLNVGYDLNPHCRVFAGYSVMYWSHAARPGNQIDPRLDENLFPIPALRPGPGLPANGVGPISRVESQSVWVQGANVGLLFKW